MPAIVRVVHMRSKVLEQGSEGCEVINTCSNSNEGWQRDLSPFILGPCELYGGFEAQTMENAWQFSKVYAKHVGEDGLPTKEWWDWSTDGWMNPKAHRFPMGRGAKPEYSYWEIDGEPQKFKYIDARKNIYAPVYAKAVQKTDGFKKLKELYENLDLLVLRDFDGWDYTKKNMSLLEVLNYPNKIMGHACVLSMLLQNDDALGEFRKT